MYCLHCSGYTEYVKVCFHVVVSPSLRQSGGKVAVLREKDPSRYYLIKKRELNDLDPGYAEFEGLFTVKRHQNITTFRYSYCVVHTEGEVREYIPNTQFRQLVILSNTNNGE
ncbi:Hypothetical predicted protein [Mytilus galloprovincialis]|uniref:Protein kinase domain-containing protein n=1 Tax=Mytilus galloprovincialis TaxID=29158 RepID=A0A8B6CP81_MYTGA|nr:Hypothetical predicted protein [Mytilus galloprovincialis]